MVARNEREIIIIDDSISILEFLKSALSKMGFEKIHICTTGDDGITIFKKLANEILPIIFLDYHLPSESAESILKEITDFKPLTKVVLVTAQEKSQEEIKNIISMGIYHYMSKPFRLDDLEKIVETIENEESRL